MGSRDLARFLREHRARLRPEDVGLPEGRRRRTPGLRREEVADLASMSVDYYARLEQARGPRPSPRILESLTGALRLRPAERRHLFRLAGTPLAPPAAPNRQVRPHVARLLMRLPDAAAIVTDATYTVVGWNPLAEALLGDPRREPNLARRRFVCPGPPMSTAAEEFGRVIVSRLRAASVRYPHDPGLRRLLTELSAGSEEFTELWKADPVHAPGHRTKSIRHPELGWLKVNCDVLAVPDDDQEVVFVTADPGSAADRAIRHLRTSHRTR